mmetsp:Transcript_22948/g.53188  ORF Transcript_22948/g.53188 Transcript_22948/m.53188 type:complete len:85 (-) Transcript_22948:1124-1378(-)
MSTMDVNSTPQGQRPTDVIRRWSWQYRSSQARELKIDQNPKDGSAENGASSTLNSSIAVTANLLYIEAAITCKIAAHRFDRKLP